MNPAYRSLAVLAVGFVLSFNVSAQDTNTVAATPAVVSATPSLTITTHEAIQNIGKTATVCGMVAEARYLKDMKSKLTFLNMDAPHPDQSMDVIIEEADRANFSEAPEVLYKGKKICVTGLIEEFKSKAQIKVTSPKQITVESSAP